MSEAVTQLLTASEEALNQIEHLFETFEEHHNLLTKLKKNSQRPYCYFQALIPNLPARR
ncbi:hypothetical protein M569_15677 [Genlisea aurea]|uniref:Uncharacterized protein n=1 Tax=Genlisea aurea TaxID=192259 RepID=S8D8U7_9LAMI|nr:hypothetical protein M569_15677 [Genlisea aurea]